MTETQEVPLRMYRAMDTLAGALAVALPIAGTMRPARLTMEPNGAATASR